MYRSILYGIKFRHILISTIVFVLIAFIVSWLVSLERNRINQQLRSEITNDVVSVRAKIETELNSNSFLLKGLAVIINNQPDLDNTDINRALKTFYQFAQHLHNVGIAPGNRLSYVYPLQGNESAVGLYYPDNAAQWPAVKKAIDSRTTYLAGPVDLLQGGSGLISRTPIFLDDGTYWGILSLVLDSDSLWQSVGITREGEGVVSYALRGRDGLGQQGEIFFGNEALFDSTQSSILIDIQVPGGSWQLAAQPAEGWGARQNHLNVIEAAAIFMAGLFMVAVLIVFSKQHRVEVTEKRLRTILNTTKDAVIVFNKLGRITEFNPATIALFKYTEEDLLGVSIQAIINVSKDSKTKVKFDNFWLNQGWKQGETRDLSGITQQGKHFPVELNVGETVVEDDILFVVSVRDISERKAAEKRLEILATTDGLTEIYNRRTGLELGEMSFLSAGRYKRPFSVMMLDVDHFKNVNDTYGHEAGDRVLIALVKIVKEELRTSDIFCRFGGEEFLLFMPETEIVQAEQVAKRLLALVRKSSIITKAKQAIKITVSIGVSAMVAEEKELSTIINNADVALYQAKEGGRDRVCAVLSEKIRELPPEMQGDEMSWVKDYIPH